MTVLRLHRDLYEGTAIDAAVKLFGPFGTFVLSKEPAHYVVEVTCPSPKKERKVTRELSNYALGLTIQGRKAQAA